MKNSKTIKNNLVVILTTLFIIMTCVGGAFLLIPKSNTSDDKISMSSVQVVNSVVDADLAIETTVGNVSNLVRSTKIYYKGATITYTFSAHDGFLWNKDYAKYVVDVSLNANIPNLNVIAYFHDSVPNPIREAKTANMPNGGSGKLITPAGNLIASITIVLRDGTHEIASQNLLVE